MEFRMMQGSRSEPGKKKRGKGHKNQFTEEKL